MESIEIDTVNGDSVEPWLEHIARLRIRIFREFPYLYEGTMDYESDYLRKYSRSEAGVFILAKFNGKVIGAATGLPLKDADQEFQAPFHEQEMNTTDYFYFGESILEKDFRGRGIGHMFFDAREAFAWQQGYRLTTFCAVERPADHPQWPAGYRTLQPFWETRGYFRQENLTTAFKWQDIGHAVETAKTMTFWVKDPL